MAMRNHVLGSIGHRNVTSHRGCRLGDRERCAADMSDWLRYGVRVGLGGMPSGAWGDHGARCVLRYGSET
jgi:hypothetical protein